MKLKDVVLINPNYVKAENFYKINFHLAIQRYPPLHLAYLASSLEKANIGVYIIDAAALDLSDEKVIKLLKKYKPKIVGIYVNSFFLPIVNNLIQKIRSDVDCIIVLGGPHITHQPSSIIKLGADYGFSGEAEKSLVEFINSKNRKKTPGLIHKLGKTVKINSTEFIKDLDSLPFPARHLLPNEKYYMPFFDGKTTTMMPSRGCTFNCIFCGGTKRKYREVSVERVLGEIENIISMGFKYIQMQDDTFSLNKRRVSKICKEIIKRRLDITWGCETRADFLDKSLIYLMKKAGCTNVQFGVESGSEKVRNEIIGKNLSTDIIRETTKNLKNVGMITISYFMFGHPTETYKDMKKTFEFAKSLKLDYVDFHLAVPIPGSRLFDIACREGKIKENVWDDVIFGAQIPVYVPDNVTLEQMIELQRKAYSEFYFNVPMLIKISKNITSLNDLCLKIKTGLIVLKNKYIR